MPVVTAAQALVRSLAREGVEVIFGLPGFQIMDVFDVLHGEPGIRLVTVRHEQATTYVADGYARTTGKVGVGAKIGNPGRQVVAICGDGGFMYGIPDLATAVQEEANMVTLVFNNSSFGASLADQRKRYGGRVYGIPLRNPDFVQLADSFGALGIKISGPEELGDALRNALKSDWPVVIEVPVPVLDPPFQIPLKGTVPA